MVKGKINGLSDQINGLRGNKWFKGKINGLRGK